jgi:hypothetical protein
MHSLRKSPEESSVNSASGTGVARRERRLCGGHLNGRPREAGKRARKKINKK